MTDSRWQGSYPSFDDYLRQVSRGNVKGANYVLTYGHVELAGAVTENLVSHNNGTVLNVPSSSGVQMSIVSDNIADDAAGTGLRTLRIDYLDADLNPQNETVTLDGTTPVTTVATDIRWVQSLTGITFGSNTRTVGEITISNGGTDYAKILAAHRAGESSFFRVPTGKILYIGSVYAGVNSGAGAAKVLVEVASTSKVYGAVNNQESGLFYTSAGMSLQDASEEVLLPLPLPLSAGHIVGLAVSSDKAASVSGGLIGWTENAQ